ncbi:uroporphyrinogen-III synthase [Psychromonas ingrahamii 37]|uniref:Uroporphyrinogen-III synthase n=1 Tax=Psychromonas ingrahamii (strain DSM 17664 / CCUG 51855 / 37) TaxID=357804 RepID=A1T0Q9_PSYIN|nr:uroporphyrinogen-III synthase [Psychromonas ingrahamii]ABM05324.1 uroporphyrinogen-III synthase [Psychromonas ingrahamii 37]
MKEARLLVTRFAPHAQRLVNLLNAQGTVAFAQPLLALQKTTEFNHASKVLAKNYDYIIAVSPNAVDYTQKALAGINWPQTEYLAVGLATQAKLKAATTQNVVVPEKCFDSEGLLDLPLLLNLQGKHILILRGVGGRELLCDTLRQRGAIVDYYQPYQRVAIVLCGKALIKEWQQQNINGAIISSIELLERLMSVVPLAAHEWLKELTIYAPSERILDQAKRWGWSNTKVLPGMSDQQVIDYFKH